MEGLGALLLIIYIIYIIFFHRHLWDDFSERTRFWVMISINTVIFLATIFLAELYSPLIWSISLFTLSLIVFLIYSVWSLYNENNEYYKKMQKRSRLESDYNELTGTHNYLMSEICERLVQYSNTDKELEDEINSEQLCTQISKLLLDIQNANDKTDFYTVKKLLNAVDIAHQLNNLRYDYRELKLLTQISELKSVCKNIDADYQDYDAKIHELLQEMETTKEVCNNKVENINNFCNKLKEQCKFLKIENDFFNSTKSNLTAIPYMASIIADYETYGLEKLAKSLDWGSNVERAKKVKSLRELRADTKLMIEKYKQAQYQLSYLLELFPNLADVIECDYNQLPLIDVETISEYDTVRDWLSKEEYQSLSSVERNQLALDRYFDSHNKTKWQIGRDYELFVGYKYMQKGYSVDYFGSYMGLEDLGRDIIAKKGNKTLIVQCKYWSNVKQIHEKHITQLYGTTISYCIENNLKPESVTGILVTNISLSDTAKKMADFLKIKYVENLQKDIYPCIKCNIGHDEYGEAKIYHLPIDLQYDATKIDKPGEFFALTVKEAEDAGFRRAFKWFQ